MFYNIFIIIINALCLYFEPYKIKKKLIEQLMKMINNYYYSNSYC